MDLSGPLLREDIVIPPQQVREGFVGYWPEYPLDVDKKNWRISPIFRDVEAAVSWLTKAASTWRSPFPGKVHLYGREFGSPDSHSPDPRDGHINFELIEQYGGYAYDIQEMGDPPLATVVFRGQKDARWGLIPKLYQVFQRPRISWAEAVKFSNHKIQDADQFVQEFFTDPDTLKELPQLASLGGPSRAAMARHYGYHSQFIDFTADPGVAAFFATEEEPLADTSIIGSLWYLDEAHLIHRFFNEAVIRTPRFEHRFLFQDSVSELRSLLLDTDVGSRGADWSGPPDAWDFAATLPVIAPFKSCGVSSVVGSAVQLSLSLFFAPGSIVPRMNAQTWCAVELNTHLGWDKGAIIRSILLHQLLERLAGRVNFLHGGKPYEGTYEQKYERKRGRVGKMAISSSILSPPDDPIKRAIKRYQKKVGMAPE